MPGKNYEISILRCSPGFVIFHLTVNKLITDKTQNIFWLIAEYSGFMKYVSNNLDEII